MDTGRHVSKSRLGRSNQSFPKEHQQTSFMLLYVQPNYSGTLHNLFGYNPRGFMFVIVFIQTLALLLPFAALHPWISCE
uniref:Uncharacterized protein n=1 Tax=Magallana gigas TaxID=29159 RepID=K1PPJ7_MAGGI